MNAAILVLFLKQQKPKEVIALIKLPAKNTPYQTVVIRKPTRSNQQPASPNTQLTVVPKTPPAKTKPNAKPDPKSKLKPKPKSKRRKKKRGKKKRGKKKGKKKSRKKGKKKGKKKKGKKKGKKSKKGKSRNKKKADKAKKVADKAKIAEKKAVKLQKKQQLEVVKLQKAHREQMQRERAEKAKIERAIKQQAEKHQLERDRLKGKAAPLSRKQQPKQKQKPGMPPSRVDLVPLPVQVDRNKPVIVRLDQQVPPPKPSQIEMPMGTKPVGPGAKPADVIKWPKDANNPMVVHPSAAILPPNPGHPLYEKSLPADLTKNVVQPQSNVDGQNTENVVKLANDVVRMPNIMAKVEKQAESLHINEKDLSDVLSQVEKAKTVPVDKHGNENVPVQVKKDGTDPATKKQDGSDGKTKKQDGGDPELTNDDEKYIVELEVKEGSASNRTKAVISMGKKAGAAPAEGGGGGGGGGDNSRLPMLIGKCFSVIGIYISIVQNYYSIFLYCLVCFSMIIICIVYNTITTSCTCTRIGVHCRCACIQ